MSTESVKKSYKKYYYKNREKILARHKRKQQDYKERKTRERYKREYGITVEEVEDLKLKQDGCCAICQERKPLCVDHNHDTGLVRGLLCSNCNMALGHFKDSILYLQKAIEYLNARP